jgi:hypothetical protein
MARQRAFDMPYARGLRIADREQNPCILIAHSGVEEPLLRGWREIALEDLLDPIPQLCPAAGEPPT